jgi:choline dehydrogenase-like flavoprotein
MSHNAEIPASARECDVCIVGAGPAGLTVALELAGSGLSVVILESGGADSNATVQDLNDGMVLGSAYAGLRATRHRALGGTANSWNTSFGTFTGAKYVPLDPWDLESHPQTGLPGWPIDFATLERYYKRAQARCGLGIFSYDADDTGSPERRPWSFQSQSLLCSRIYQFGPTKLFTTDHVNTLRASSNVSILDHSTAVGLLRGQGDQVACLEVRDTRTGAPFTVAATHFVLAGGAIENARLLLHSAPQLNSLIEGGQWVGRCFMEHPRDWGFRLVPRSKELLRAAAFYDVHANGAHSRVCGRLGLTPSAAASLRSPNFSITLLPHLPAGWARRQLRRLGLIRDRRGYGWSLERDPAAFFDRFQLVINLEQRPRAENRLVLARESDAFGVPRPELHWTWSPAEQSDWDRSRPLIAAEIESIGVGRIERLPTSGPDPNAHHHSGTTRMSEDPAWGVVDPDCRVHGTSNLYVAGASVFPSGGFANPTLTIVALAIRLAEHLRMRVNGAVGCDGVDRPLT